MVSIRLLPIQICIAITFQLSYEIAKMPRKRKWTDEMKSDLKQCQTKALKLKQEMASRGQKISYLEVMRSEFIKLYPKLTYPATALQSQLFQIKKSEQAEPECVEKENKIDQIRWTKELKNDLKSTKERIERLQDNESVRKEALLEEWNKLHPSLPLSLKGLNLACTRLQSGSQDTIPNPSHTSQVSDDINIEQGHPELYSAFDAHVRHVNSTIFDAVCYNCGFLLYDAISKGHKFRVPKTHKDEKAPITITFTEEIPLPYESRGGIYWYCCKICLKNREHSRTYSTSKSIDEASYIPEEVKALNKFELSQIALLFSNELCSC